MAASQNLNAHENVRWETKRQGIFPQLHEKTSCVRLFGSLDLQARFRGMPIIWKKYS